MDAFVSHFAHALGDLTATVEQSAAAGRLVATAEQFREAGFSQHRLAADRQNSYDLAKACVSKIANDLEGTGAIIYSTCLTLNGNIGNGAVTPSAPVVNSAPIIRVP